MPSALYSFPILAAALGGTVYISALTAVVVVIATKHPQNTRRGVRNYRRRIVGIRSDRKALTAGGAR